MSSSSSSSETKEKKQSKRKAGEKELHAGKRNKRSPLTFTDVPVFVVEFVLDMYLWYTDCVSLLTLNRTHKRLYADVLARWKSAQWTMQMSVVPRDPSDSDWNLEMPAFDLRRKFDAALCVSEPAFMLHLIGPLIRFNEMSSEGPTCILQLLEAFYLPVGRLETNVWRLHGDTLLRKWQRFNCSDWDLNRLRAQILAANRPVPYTDWTRSFPRTPHASDRCFLDSTTAMLKQCSDIVKSEISKSSALPYDARTDVFHPYAHSIYQRTLEAVVTPSKSAVTGSLLLADPTIVAKMKAIPDPNPDAWKLRFPLIRWFVIDKALSFLISELDVMIARHF